MSAATSPQDAQALRAHVSRAGTILLTGPKEIDGDSLGSCLALALILRRTTQAEVHVAGIPGWRYADLPGVERNLANDQVAGRYDVVMVLDGDSRRLAPELKPVFARAKVKVVIDHHDSTSADSYDVALLDKDAASTCQIVIALAQEWGVELDGELAELLYTGIAYDTGGFRHSNTDSQTLRMAAQLLETGIDHSRIVIRTAHERRVQGIAVVGHVLESLRFEADGRLALGCVELEFMESIGAQAADIDFVIDLLLYVDGVEVAVLAVERRVGEGCEVKLSLRSRGDADVCRIANQLHETGGGHKRAAGVVLDGALDDVLRRVVLPKLLSELSPSG